MKTITFSEDKKRKYRIAILIKRSSLSERELTRYYVEPLLDLGYAKEDVIAIELIYGVNNKTTATQRKNAIELLVPYLLALNVEYVLCADSAYFTQLTKAKKPDSQLASVHPMAVQGAEHINVCYTLNHSALLYNPAQSEKIITSIQTLANHDAGNHQETQIKFDREYYPVGAKEIAKELDHLLGYPVLTVDIEAFSLKLDKAKIGTISFAHSPTEGSAFLVDYYPTLTEDGSFGCTVINTKVRQLLKDFFIAYQGKLVAHRCSYDFKVLIYELFMSDPLDKVGMLDGLDILTRSYDDTMLMAYCCLNSTSREVYGLKQLGQEHAGNYAESNIKDIRKIDPYKLLKYNLTDTCTTFWVWEKYSALLVKEEQDEYYNEMVLPMQKVLLQVELHGMPMYPERIEEVKGILKDEEDKQLNIINSSPYLIQATKLIQKDEMDKANAKLKTKQHTIEKFENIVFNPGSSKQLGILLYHVMDLPVINLTSTKLPSVDGDTLEALINHADEQDKKDILIALIAYFKANKVLTTFIPAFEKGILKADGYRYLHGSFNIHGTVSGRLSGSDPNLQNMPSGSLYGKLTKYIFGVTGDRIMVGADYESLEDYISALLSKDPNKMKIYLDGYDSHCYRAFAYWPQMMPDIVPTVASINSIKVKYPVIRQDSKAPTFLLTYGGSWMGLVKNAGLPEPEAKRIEKAYHELYVVSDQYTAKRIQEASRVGYTKLAFGFKLRTPLLKNTVVGSRQSIREAAGEARTVGNAFGQSYGLLNNRAMIAFMRKVWASPYRYDIMPIAPIHDASYYVIDNSVEVLKFINDNLIKEMQWQDLPEIAHDKVKLGGQLDVFYESWDRVITVANNLTEQQLLDACQAAADKFDKE